MTSRAENAEAQKAIEQILRIEGSMPRKTLKWYSKSRGSPSPMPTDVFDRALRLLKRKGVISFDGERVSYVGGK